MVAVYLAAPLSRGAVLAAGNSSRFAPPQSLPVSFLVSSILSQKSLTAQPGFLRRAKSLNILNPADLIGGDTTSARSERSERNGNMQDAKAPWVVLSVWHDEVIGPCCKERQEGEISVCE